MRLYRYVGPAEIAARVRPELLGTPIRSADDLHAFLGAAADSRAAELTTFAYVVDADGVLRLGDRRSEHVALAGGEPVQSAGEIELVAGRTVETEAVSNQSTGYCPEPESWPAVAAALARAGLQPPPGAEGFTLACTFRRCGKCETVNIVKEQVFECAVCGAALPKEYNCQPAEAKPK